MTDEETLNELERGLNEINPDEWHKHVSRYAVAAVAQDARLLRELVAALPKCNVSKGCQRPGVYEWHNEDLACDEHLPPNRIKYQLPYASVLRRIERGG